MDGNNNGTPSGNPTPPQGGENINETVANLKKQLADIQPFIEDASYLVAAIYSDQQLKETVQNRLKNPSAPLNNTAAPNNQNQNQNQDQNQNNQNMNNNNNNQNNNQWKFDPMTGQPIGQQNNNQNNNNPQNQVRNSEQTRTDVIDMDIKMREDIIDQVERKLGYSNLDGEKRKELRKNVEKRLNGWNSSVMTSPVHTLGKLLEDAYLLSDIKPAVEQGRLEGLVSAYNNNMGAFPTMGSQSPAQDTTGNLTPEHQEWAKKMGVTDDKVSARLKEFRETGVMTYQPKEQQQQNNNNPAPSGNPTPPAQGQQPQNQQ